jgi:hypothetical protein
MSSSLSKSVSSTLPLSSFSRWNRLKSTENPYQPRLFLIWQNPLTPEEQRRDGLAEVRDVVFPEEVAARGERLGESLLILRDKRVEGVLVIQ